MLTRDIEEHVEVCSNDDHLIFDKTPQVRRYLTYFAHQ